MNPHTVQHSATTPRTNHDVIIVGGGPTGLMLAAELALARVNVAIVEKRIDQSLKGSRAGGLHAGTIEMFDMRGIAGRFLSEGQSMQVAGFSFIPLDISDFPIRRNHGLALRQNHIERIMADWVNELPVTFHRGREVGRFTQYDTHVQVDLADGSSLQSRYLVGCDGGRSVVRKHAGIDFEGWDASTSWLIAEAEFRDEPAWGVRRGSAGVNAIGKLEDGQRAGIVLAEPRVGTSDEPTLDDLKQALLAVYGTDSGVHNCTWLSRFTDMARQATTYRKGRVLLAGDAAHVHAPSGGQGLNLGVQDAMNLGWKLAQVVHGVSNEDLLDTYHSERHPLAARVLRLTMAQSVLGRGDPHTEALRDVVADLLRLDEPRKRYGAIMSQLDVRYDCGDGHPLRGRRMPDLDIETSDGAMRVYDLLRDARPVFITLAARDDKGRHSEPERLDISQWTGRVRVVQARCAARWELPLVGEVAAPPAVLVRPDGHVAWAGEGAQRGLELALSTWCGDGGANTALQPDW